MRIKKKFGKKRKRKIPLKISKTINNNVGLITEVYNLRVQFFQSFCRIYIGDLKECQKLRQDFNSCSIPTNTLNVMLSGDLKRLVNNLSLKYLC